MPEVLVAPGRLERWVENFERRHGATRLDVAHGALLARAEDGSTFAARLPFDRRYGGAPDPSALATAAAPPGDWGILLVRKGGFAVARMAGDRMAASKTGQRHVQGRSKAGGWSQQRFARRRGEQARVAYEAAADHAARLLGGLTGPVATGGDHAAVEAVLADPRLAGVRPVERWLPVPDPKRAVLDQAVRDAGAIGIAVTNADAP